MPGNFLHFVLRKNNVDTMHAAHLISKALRLRHGAIGQAGVKDRRGITTQRMSGQRLDPAQLLSLLATRFPFLEAGNFSIASRPLR